MAVSRPLHLTRRTDARPLPDDASSPAEAVALPGAGAGADAASTAFDAAAPSTGPGPAAPAAEPLPDSRAPDDLRPPNALLMALEGRAALEWMASLAMHPFMDPDEPGDGHTVVVFPGLGASDLSTAPLRRFLARQGFDPQRWNLGLNLGPREGVLDACRELVRSHHARSGRPVSLIGWSLGGIYARELAKEMPERVRCVVTLGSPFSGPPQATNAWRLFEMVSGQSAHQHELLGQLHVPPPVPTTSIYSRTDGVVAWQCSLNPVGPLSENIEVQASHLGMAANPIVQHAIADRLRQDPAGWRPFAAGDGARRFFFPARPAASAAGGTRRAA